MSYFDTSAINLTNTGKPEINTGKPETNTGYFAGITKESADAFFDRTNKKPHHIVKREIELSNILEVYGIKTEDKQTAKFLIHLVKICRTYNRSIKIDGCVSELKDEDIKMILQSKFEGE